jgi:hypothetical protein
MKGQSALLASVFSFKMLLVQSSPMPEVSSACHPPAFTEWDDKPLEGFEQNRHNILPKSNRSTPGSI